MLNNKKVLKLFKLRDKWKKRHGTEKHVISKKPLVGKGSQAVSVDNTLEPELLKSYKIIAQAQALAQVGS